MRCVHEASLHQENCFLTLTYDNEHCPQNMSLNKRDWQLFMKRLRKDEPDTPIRYYMCGEYGDQYQRPHYHACIFGYSFPDKTFYKYTGESSEHSLYTSDQLDHLWGHGIATIGELTFETAAYTARYVMKKVNGQDAEEHYQGRMPEFTLMSRRPGIGKGWFDKYSSDVYPHDFTVLNNKKLKPPKAYDVYYEQAGGDLESLKLKRKEHAELHSDNNTPERLKVREEIQQRKLERLKRQHDA